MLPNRCQKPPCRNIEVTMVSQGVTVTISGSRLSSPSTVTGIMPRRKISSESNWSPPMAWTIQTMVQAAISPTVTNWKPIRLRGLSSLSGRNMAQPRSRQGGRLRRALSRRASPAAPR